MTTRESRHFRRDTVHFAASEGMEQDQVRDVSRVTWVGVFVNIFLAVVKSVGGLLSGSKALVADAVHTVSDLATDIAILVGVRYWSAPADVDHPHGHRKIETLITLAIGIALAAVGVVLGYEAVESLAAAIAGKREAKPATELGIVFWIGLGAAALSIASKELLYRWTSKQGVKLGSSAVVANAWHHRSDAISSIPPLLSMGGEALGREMGYDLWFLDPVGTVIVCVMLLQAAWDIGEPTLGALLDASADRKLCSAIRETALATKGVISTHRIRTRVICSNAVAVDLHIAVDKYLTVERGHQIAGDVKYRILGLDVQCGARAVDVMVHVEPADPASTRMPSGDGRDTMVDWKYNPPGKA